MKLGSTAELSDKTQIVRPKTNGSLLSSSSNNNNIKLVNGGSSVSRLKQPVCNLKSFKS